MCEQHALSTDRPFTELLELALTDLTDSELQRRYEATKLAVEHTGLDCEAHQLAFTYYRRGGLTMEMELHEQRHKMYVYTRGVLVHTLNEIQQERKRRDPFCDE